VRTLPAVRLLLLLLACVSVLVQALAHLDPVELAQRHFHGAALVAAQAAATPGVRLP
jgi:hypothetical protein